MIAFLSLALRAMVSLLKVKVRLEAEIIMLRHRLNVLRWYVSGSIRRECLDHVVVFGGACPICTSCGRCRK